MNESGLYPPPLLCLCLCINACVCVQEREITHFSKYYGAGGQKFLMCLTV